MNMNTQHPRLRTLYQETIRHKLKESLKLKNIMAVPRVSKITVNIGLGASKKDPKIAEIALRTLERITGQKPVMTKAKKSISGFKIREGMAIGAMVTLRGNRMYDFMDKLVNLTLPRVRDFSGLSTGSFDAQGNYNIGIKEHVVFPEIRSDEVEKIHGLQITISTTTTSAMQGFALLEAFGFPFKK